MVLCWKAGSLCLAETLEDGTLLEHGTLLLRWCVDGTLENCTLLERWKMVPCWNAGKWYRAGTLKNGTLLER